MRSAFGTAVTLRRTMVDFGEVAERSNATDCKSVGLVPSEVRILPSPPGFGLACESGNE